MSHAHRPQQVVHQQQPDLQQLVEALAALEHGTCTQECPVRHLVTRHAQINPPPAPPPPPPKPAVKSKAKEIITQGLTLGAAAGEIFIVAIKVLGG